MAQGFCQAAGLRNVVWIDLKLKNAYRNFKILKEGIYV
jgi:hypothetical protein